MHAHEWYKVQRDLVICPRPTFGEWQSWTPDPDVHELSAYIWITRSPKDAHNFLVKLLEHANSPFPCPVYSVGRRLTPSKGNHLSGIWLSAWVKTRASPRSAPLELTLWFLAVQPEILLSQ